jgi:hypothetical protein
MTRSAARRGTIQTEKSPPPPPDHPDDERSPLPPAEAVPWQWRLALFLWGTSFAFLLLYEWLAGIIKAW